MKNWIKVLGIIVVAAVIGLTVASCNGNGDDDDGDKKDPTVNWPSGFIATEGDLLSSITLPNNGSGTAGAFAWTTPAAPVDGVGLRSHNMTFTPTDTATYNAKTQDVQVRVCPEGMVWIEAGTFLMGPDIWNDKATVQVSFSKGFYMGKYQVTQELYELVMEANPSYFHGGDGREPEASEVQGKRPVETVNWYHAIAFCNRLSILEGLTPVYTIGSISNSDADAWLHSEVPTSNDATWNAATPNWDANGYRLPTDAQWEYAAKGGNGSPGNFTYSGSNDIDDVAWYSVNSGSKTHEVGLKAPNGLGIYDMSGNVWEWCWDRYGDYPSEPVTDYYGAAAGTVRVFRGGSWRDSAGITQSVSPLSYDPGYRVNALGFRLVRP